MNLTIGLMIICFIKYDKEGVLVMKYYPAFMSLLSKECRLVKNTNSQRFFMVKEPDQYPGFAKIANCDS
jgi:hypothetical protein